MSNVNHSHASPPHLDWLHGVDRRLRSQLQFLLEADRLKTVLRGSRIADGSRRENSAEHSWHLALFAMVLHEHAVGDVNVSRALCMLLLHDLVEIECGDSPVFDAAACDNQAEREQLAADKVFGLLPIDQCIAMRRLWDEFEAANSADARFAKALDRFQPVLLNHLVRGGTWTDYAVDEARERAMNGALAERSPVLWQVCEQIYDDAVSRGWLRAS